MVHSIFHKTEEDFIDPIEEPNTPNEHFWGSKILNLLRKHYEVSYENNRLGLNRVHYDQRRVMNFDLLIDRKFEDYFYKELCHEKNLIYRHGIYISVVILNRKLFECLLIEFLEKKFSGKDDLYYDENRKRYSDLKDLIKVLREQSSELSDRKNKLNRLIGNLEKYRQAGNIFLLKD